MAPARRRKPVVVDDHHRVLPSLLRVLRQRPPGSPPCAMLHFDSHPDLACLSTKEAPPALLQALIGGTVDPGRLMQACGIATWILPLILAGYVDTVVWYSAWWCSQMDVGRYALQVGVVQGRRMMVSGQDGVPPEAYTGCAPYWETDGAWASGAAGSTPLRAARPWTLHVCRLRRAASPPWAMVAGRDRPWILDVDEDFLSCSNPFRDTLEAFLGRPGCKIVRQAYQPLVGTLRAHWKRLRALVVPHHCRSPGTGEALRVSTSVGTLRRVSALLKTLRADEPPVLPMEWLHAAGEGMGLPHHISTVVEISDLLRQMARIVAHMQGGQPPLLVTIARSAVDGYVPGSQSVLLHRCVYRFLASRV